MQKKFIILISLITLSLASIAYLSSKESSYVLLDTSQLADSPDQYQKQNLRVRGFVKVGSLIREGNRARFQLEYKNKTVPVDYDGSTILPDAFKEGASVRVDGRWQNGKLMANHVEAKCASKYQAEYHKDGPVAYE